MDEVNAVPWLARNMADGIVSFTAPAHPWASPVRLPQGPSAHSHLTLMEPSVATTRLPRDAGGCSPPQVPTRTKAMGPSTTALQKHAQLPELLDLTAGLAGCPGAP